MNKIFKYNELKLLIKYSKDRNNSMDQYFLFQKYQGELLVKFLSNTNIELAGKNLLDLGCGFGGYSKAFLDASAKVIGLDLSLSNNQYNIPMVSGDALVLPFKNNSFDIVICASLIEHVPQPFLLLTEISRVLKTGGLLYLGFPPFYSPVGGHQFSPYHLLGEKISVALSQRHGIYKPSPWIKDSSQTDDVKYSTAYGQWGLYPITIKRFKNLINNLPFKVIRQSTRYSLIDFSRIPLIGEFLTWHVQFIIRKL